jgi:hypothetical protein
MPESQGPASRAHPTGSPATKRRVLRGEEQGPPEAHPSRGSSMRRGKAIAGPGRGNPSRFCLRRQSDINPRTHPCQSLDVPTFPRSGRGLARPLPWLGDHASGGGHCADRLPAGAVTGTHDSVAASHRRCCLHHRSRACIRETVVGQSGAAAISARPTRNLKEPEQVWPPCTVSFKNTGGRSGLRRSPITELLSISLCKRPSKWGRHQRQQQLHGLAVESNPTYRSPKGSVDRLSPVRPP